MKNDNVMEKTKSRASDDEKLYSGRSMVMDVIASYLQAIVGRGSGD